MDGVIAVKTATPASDVRQSPDRRQLITALLPLLMLIILVAILSVLQPAFLSARNGQALALSLAPILLLAIGQTFVILTGGIDLSSATLTSLGTVLLAHWLPHLGAGAVPLMIIVITVLGSLTGLVSARLQLPTFIVSLGSMGLWSGVAMVVSHASTIAVSPAAYLPLQWLNLALALIPMPAIIAIGAVVISAILVTFLARGRILHAVGLAEQAVLMSGGSTIAARWSAFALSGLCSALAALVLVGTQYSGGPSLADSLQLPVIAAVVVGGTAITGGTGGVVRTLVGSGIVLVLTVGLSAVGANASYDQIVYGVVIIIAIIMTRPRGRDVIVK